jgi:hypothetical protein
MDKTIVDTVKLNMLYSLGGLDGFYGKDIEKYTSGADTSYFIFNDKLYIRRQTLNAKLKSRKFKKELPYEREFPVNRTNKNSNTWELYKGKDGNPVTFMEGLEVRWLINIEFKNVINVTEFEIELLEEMKNVINRFIQLNGETGIKAHVANFSMEKIQNLPKFMSCNFDLIFEDEYEIIPYTVIKKERG